MDTLETKSERWPIVGLGRGRGRRGLLFLPPPCPMVQSQSMGHPGGGVRTWLRLTLNPGETWSERVARKRKGATKADHVSSRAAEGVHPAATAPLAIRLPLAPSQSRSPAHPRFPTLRSQIWVPYLHLSPLTSFSSCFDFLCTCLLLAGPFSESHTFSSRCSVYPTPHTKHPRVAWYRGAEPRLQRASGPDRAGPGPSASGALPDPAFLSTQPAPELALLRPLPPAPQSCQRKVTMTSFYLL